jgi:CheY-like chemotaxis protein
MDKLPDPLRSRVVLIGVTNYRNLTPLPAVHNNLADLAIAFSSDQLWGLPPSHCVVIEDPETPEEMLDPLVDFAQNATDTLLLYYAGHGLVDPLRSELHITRPGSDPLRMHTAVPYNQVRDVLLSSPATRRIVILDCCYSGRALGQMSDPTAALAEEASAEGTYILAAAAENKKALAPQGQSHTTFTGVLLDTMNNGIVGRGPLLNLDSIYQHLRAVMRMKGLPLPQARDRNTAGLLYLIRNQAFTADKRHSLVVVDCEYLVSVLHGVLDEKHVSDRQKFRTALHEVLSFLTGQGEVRVYAIDMGIQAHRDVLDVATKVGAAAIVIPKEKGLGRPFDPIADMVIEAASALRSTDQFVLVADDNNFVPIVAKARAADVFTIVARFPKVANSTLSAGADRTIEIPFSSPSDARLSAPQVQLQQHKRTEDDVRIDASPSKLPPIVRNILLVDTEDEWRSIYVRAAAGAKFNTIRVANDLATAAALIDEMQFSVTVLEIGLDVTDDRNIDGMLVMEKIRAVGDETGIVVITGRAGLDVLSIVRDAIKKYQAYDTISKATLTPSYLRTVIQGAQQSYEERVTAIHPFTREAFSNNTMLKEWNDEMDRIRGLRHFVDRLLTPFLPIVPRRDGESLYLDTATATMCGSCWSRSVGRPIAFCFAERGSASEVIENAKSARSLIGRYEISEVLEESVENGLAGAVFALSGERNAFAAI